MGVDDELVEPNPLHEERAGVDQGDGVAASEVVGRHHASISGADDDDLGLHTHTSEPEARNVTLGGFST